MRVFAATSAGTRAGPTGRRLAGRRLTARASAAAGLAALLAACGSGAGTAGGGGAGGKPAEGGTVTIGVTNGLAPDSLDPSLGTSGSDILYDSLIYEPLIRANPKTGVLQPGLATSWKFTGPKNLEFDLTLRRGVRFQDGTPFNAAAAKFSLDYVQNEVHKITYIKDVRVTGPYSVAIDLNQPYAILPNQLSGWNGDIVSPTAVKKLGKKFATHPVGAGPFRFDSMNPGSSVTLSRYPGYFDATSTHLDAIKFNIYSGDAPLVSALRGNVVQFAFNLNPQDVAQLKGASDTTVSLGVQPGGDIIYLNTKLAPVNNRLVRLAINYALNRQAIANAATAGLGKPLWQPNPPGSAGHVNEPPPWPYSPAKARALLRQAGFPHGVSLTGYTYPGFGYDITAPIIEAELKAVGISLKVLTGTVAQVTPFYSQKLSPAYLSVWPGTGVAVQDYQGLMLSTSYYNSGHDGLGMDPLLTSLNQAYTPAAQDKVFEKIINLMNEQAPYIPLYTVPIVNAYSSGLGGFTPSAQGPNSDYFGAMYLRK